MSNLYYEVLFGHRPDIVLERTYDGLSDFYAYLKGVEKHLEDTRPTLSWDIGGHLVDLRATGNENANQHGRDLLRGLLAEDAELRLIFDDHPSIDVLAGYPEDRAVMLFDLLPKREISCTLQEISGKRRLRCLARAVARPPIKELLPPQLTPMPDGATSDDKAQAQADLKKARERWEKDPLVQRYHNLQPAWIALREPEAEGDRTAELFMDEEVDKVFEALNEQRGRYDSANQLEVKSRDPERLLLSLDRLPQTPAICVRPNTYVIRRQVEAIRRLQDQPTAMQKPLVNLFQRQDHVQWPPMQPESVDEWQVLNNEERPGTTEQRDFVERALATPDFMLLEGPPGSGKTTAILELVLQLAARGKRALLCASTHVAVDNVIERIKDPSNTLRNSVLVVRIGKEKAVRSELAREYCLERMAKTESRDLREQLNRLPMRSASQEMLREALQPPKGQERWEQTLFDCAQLVCGTTIGILQHPALKLSTVPFDYLVLDEASKTTFSEFLVPALRAKRWIIVGDRRQLSPYVDEEWIASGVAAALHQGLKQEQTDEIAQQRIHAFNTHQKQHGRRQTIEPETEAQALDPATLWASEIAWRLIREYELRLVAELRAAPESTDEELQFDLPYGFGEVGDSGDIDEGADADVEESAVPLEDELVLRYREERERLLPEGQVGQRVREAIDRVRRAALPSVLESLQVGHGKGLRTTGNSALVFGLPKAVLEERLVSLSYQHRMHPDISAFPREHIYQGRNLLDPPDQADRRVFPYPAYRHRSLWIDVQGHENKNTNKKESEIVLRELERLLEWAKSHPKPGESRGSPPGPWSVAVLTFYRGQERLLREGLRKLSGERSHRQSFTLRRGDKAALTIDLCTVDRFQGHEADVVYLSLVRTQSIGFLRSPNRLNVALTRARYQRVLVGHRAFFRGKGCRSDLLKALAECTASDRAYGEDQP